MRFFFVHVSIFLAGVTLLFSFLLGYPRLDLGGMWTEIEIGLSFYPCGFTFFSPLYLWGRSHRRPRLTD